MKDRVKVSIVGAGAVGTAAAFAVARDQLVNDLVLVDMNRDKAEGEAMDLAHGMPLVGPMNVRVGDYPETAGSDVIVITAGVAQKPGETRIELINRNIAIFKDMIPQIVEHNKDAILLVVSNPVDILAYATYKISGFPKERVIGSGTVLDSSRLRYEIAKRVELDPRDIQAHIIAEHGDTEFPAWSLATINGIPLDKYCDLAGVDMGEGVKKEIHDNVKNAAYEVINRKGNTSTAIGLSVARIVRAILMDERAVLPVSGLLEDYYGLSDVYMGLPSIVGKNGLEQVLQVELADGEAEDFKASGQALKEVIDEAL